MSYKKGRTKTVRRLLKFAALCKAVSFLASLHRPGQLYKPLGSAVAVELTQSHILSSSNTHTRRPTESSGTRRLPLLQGHAISRPTKPVASSMTSEPSRGHAQPSVPHRRINRKRTKHHSVAEKNVALLLFLETCHFATSRQVCMLLSMAVFSIFLCCCVVFVSP